MPHSIYALTVLLHDKAMSFDCCVADESSDGRVEVVKANDETDVTHAASAARKTHAFMVAPKDVCRSSQAARTCAVMCLWCVSGFLSCNT